MNTALSRYDRRTISLHWLTAFLVVSAWGMAQIIDFFPRGPIRIDARSVHIMLGAALGIVLVFRLAWRIRGGVRLPPSGRLDAVARLVHWALYALLVAEVCLGIANTWARGDSLFGLVTLPKLASDDPTLSRRINGIHELVANAILITAGLHAAAALIHHYLLRDGVLLRMLPQRGPR